MSRPRKRTQQQRSDRDPLAAVAYSRVSTDKQAADGVSLDDQETRLPAYAASRGLRLLATFREEGISAGKPLAQRPEGGRLMDMVRAGQVSHVIATKMDRLFRSAVDALTTARELEEAGVSLHILDMGGGVLDTSTPLGRMFLTLLAGFAEFERELCRERTRAASASMKARGKVYGPTPYGYRREGKDLVPDAAEQQHIHSMRAMRDQGASYRDIAAAMNRYGYAPKKGPRWGPSAVMYVLDRAEGEGR